MSDEKDVLVYLSEEDQRLGRWDDLSSGDGSWLAEGSLTVGTINTSWEHTINLFDEIVIKEGSFTYKGETIDDVHGVYDALVKVFNGQGLI